MQHRWPFVALVVVTLVPLAGCGNLLETVLVDNSQPPVKNEAGLKKLGQQLGDALLKPDYAAAYALGAAQLKGRQTEEQFTAEVKNRWQLETEGARPLRFEFEPWMPHKDEFDEWEGMPKDIKYGQLLGIVMLSYALEIEDEEVVRSLDIDAVVVDEGGEPKVAYLEFYEAD
jgi:hypothetical protein